MDRNACTFIAMWPLLWLPVLFSALYSYFYMDKAGGPRTCTRQWGGESHSAFSLWPHMSPASQSSTFHTNSHEVNGDTHFMEAQTDVGQISSSSSVTQSIGIWMLAASTLSHSLKQEVVCSSKHVVNDKMNCFGVDPWKIQSTWTSSKIPRFHRHLPFLFYISCKWSLVLLKLSHKRTP